jgi:hypothetical protein
MVHVFVGFWGERDAPVSTLTSCECQAHEGRQAFPATVLDLDTM